MLYNKKDEKMQENQSLPITARSARIGKVLALQEPDKVPFSPSVNNFYAYHYGVSIKDSMENISNLKGPLHQFLKDYDPDLVSLPPTFPIKPMETIGHNQARWPGKYWGLPDDTPYQYVDKEYLSEDDWDEYFKDPSLFILTKVLPKKYKALSGLASFDPYAICDQSILAFASAGIPSVASALRAIADTGEQVIEHMNKLIPIIASIVEAGYPVYGNATICAPFDAFADNIRGLMPACMDMVTDPGFIDDAVERWGDVSIPAGIQLAKMSHAQFIFIPLHCGIDSFMSVDNYQKHYWPSVKRLINACIDADITPIVFCEGKYNTRLETLTDIPKGKVIYTFEDVDLAEVKRIVGPYACIAAGMNTHTLMTGTPEKVEDEVKRNMDILAPGGGFISYNSIALEIVSPENMHAWRDAVEKYGKY